MKRIFSLLAVAALSCLGAQRTLAQHGHSDIEFSYVDSMVDVEFGSEGRVFEGDFALVLGTYETDNPGFVSEVSEGLGINALDYMGYDILGTMYYWNGAAEAMTDASITFVHANSSPDNILSQSGVSFSEASFVDGAFRNVIDRATGDIAGSGKGDIHQHVEWLLSAGAPVGAYGFLMQLNSSGTGIGNSETFGIVLNRGLVEDDFEAGVDHFVATRGLSAVPEPGSAVLLGFATACFAIRRSRKQ